MVRSEINWSKRRLWTANAIIAERAALNGESRPMARKPLNVREWLEDMRTYASIDGDRARELLELLDAGEAAEAELEAWDDAGFKNVADAKRLAAQLEDVEAYLEDSEIAKELGDPEDLATVKLVCEYAKKLEDQAFALQELCASAGLLDPNDHTTDPLPLLAMFLPVD